MRKKKNELNNDIKTKSILYDTCLRPDIFLDNGRHCDGCPLFDNCICHIKKSYVEPKRKFK